MAGSGFKKAVADLGFMGSYEVNLNIKSYRFVMPAEFRVFFDNQLIITRGFEASLIIVTPEKWKNLISPLRKNGLFSQTNRELLRYLIGNSFLVNIDNQGRVVIPNQLRLKQFSVSSRLFLVGMLDYIELWPSTTWSRKQKVLGKQASNLTKMLVDNGNE